MGIITLIALAIVCFLLGSIPCGVIVAKRLAGIDLRQEGSGNIGAANASRTGGAKVGLATFALDAMKAALALGIVVIVLQTWLLPETYSAANLPYFNREALYDIVAGSALVIVILGHVFSPWLHWRGGKGVSALLGGMLVIAPVPGLIAFGCFFIVLFLSGYLSLASIVGAAVLAPLTHLFYPDQPILGAGVTITAIIVILAHRGNIVRLAHKTEPKFSFAKKKS